MDSRDIFVHEMYDLPGVSLQVVLFDDVIVLLRGRSDSAVLVEISFIERAHGAGVRCEIQTGDR